MSRKKFFKWLVWTLFIIFLSAIVFVGVKFPPIMSSYAAKVVCSCVYVTGRTVESVRAEELTVYPFLPNADIQLLPDSSVTVSLLWRTRKAIYRKGLGCTLLSEQPEEKVRKEKFNIAGPPPFNQDTVAWPAGNKLSDLALDFDRERLSQILDSAFIDVEPYKPMNTHAVIVVYQGEIIGEKYASGFNENSRLMGWSMTKSIMNALIGILVRDEKLTVTDGAPIEEWQNDDRKNIRVENLLQATSGLEWSESYFNPFSDFHMMFTHKDDKAKFEATREAKYQPGEHFQYSSSSTNILSGILRKSVGDDAYFRFPYERLFYKTGMHSAIMEPDASGTFVASSFCFATARDWARFGLLFLNDGNVKGERILPEGWVEFSTTPSVAAPMGEYGAQWWLNAGEKDNPSNRIYPNLPPDAYWADGFEEQYVMVIPSKDLVIVRLGVSHHGSPFEKMAENIINCLPVEN
ncbi:MAG TPA: serine hydrolase [Cyclobacteriaceae bacterium]|nr:serine hydrolase [Cyclobacteriaceae bacterium]